MRALGLKKTNEPTAIALTRLPLPALIEALIEAFMLLDGVFFTQLLHVGLATLLCLCYVVSFPVCFVCMTCSGWR